MRHHEKGTHIAIIICNKDRSLVSSFVQDLLPLYLHLKQADNCKKNFQSKVLRC